jgi:hypothetical protein
VAREFQFILFFDLQMRLRAKPTPAARPSPEVEDVGSPSRTPFSISGPTVEIPAIFHDVR